MKVRDLVSRLSQFEQDAELKIMVGWDREAELGSVYDDTSENAVYWPQGKTFASTATEVVIELDPKRD